jgi:AAA domain
MENPKNPIPPRPSPFLIEQPPVLRPKWASEFIVNQLLPKKEVHLLAGPSGTGKTRWFTSALSTARKTGKFLNFDCMVDKWAYVLADRSIDSFRRTLGDIEINEDEMHVIPAWGDDFLTLHQIFDRVKDSGAELIFIEAFAGFCEGSLGRQVRVFLNSMYTMIRKANLTVVGVMESPKLKPYEKYELPRQRVSGAATWAHLSDTIFLLEPEDIKDPTKPGRVLTVCPRNMADSIWKSSFTKDGKLAFEQKWDSVKSILT